MAIAVDWGVNPPPKKNKTNKSAAGMQHTPPRDIFNAKKIISKLDLFLQSLKKIGKEMPKIESEKPIYKCQSRAITLYLSICNTSTLLFNINSYTQFFSEPSGSVVKCSTRYQGAAGSSLTVVTVLCPWARTFFLA